MRIITWTGEKDRPLHLTRPCSCGCDRIHTTAGYLTGSDRHGNGITVYADDEGEYITLEGIARTNSLRAAD